MEEYPKGCQRYYNKSEKKKKFGHRQCVVASYFKNHKVFKNQLYVYLLASELSDWKKKLKEEREVEEVKEETEN